jgi:hypothetical protein
MVIRWAGEREIEKAAQMVYWSVVRWADMMDAWTVQR